MSLFSTSSTRVRALGASAIAVVALLGTSLPGTAATTYALPGAPAGVTATAAPGGVLVSWSAGTDGNAAVTSYTVTGGPGTCAVVVDGTTYSAFVPAVAGQPAAAFSVRISSANSKARFPSAASFACSRSFAP